MAIAASGVSVPGLAVPLHSGTELLLLACRAARAAYCLLQSPIKRAGLIETGFFNIHALIGTVHHRFH